MLQKIALFIDEFKQMIEPLLMNFIDTPELREF